MKDKRSVTGRYLAGKEKIEVPEKRRVVESGREGDGDHVLPLSPSPPLPFSSAPSLTIRGAAHNNLKKIDVRDSPGHSSASRAFPGPARVRWSTTFWSRLCDAISTAVEGEPGDHEAIEGLEFLDKLIAIDQSPIGRTPRSNPGTYIKVFDDIRHLFTQLPESKRRGYKPGRFSFNVSGGRCEACEGNGSNKLEMDFPGGCVGNLSGV